MTAKTKRFPSMVRKGFKRRNFKRSTTPLGRLMNQARRPLLTMKRSISAGTKMGRASRQTMGNSAIRSRGVRTG